MAWTAVRTYATGDVILASWLNTDIRDNLTVLALHDHSGGSGQGTRALGAGTGLTTITFADAAAPGTPTGTLTALFSTGSRIAILSSGGTIVLFATSGHEHTLVQAQIGTQYVPGTQGPNVVSVYTYKLSIPTIYTASASGSLSTAITVGGSGSRAVFVGGYVVLTKEIATNDCTLGLQILREGTVLGTHELIPTSDPGAAFGLRFSTLIIPPTGSQTYGLRVKGTSGTTAGVVSNWLGGVLFVSELTAS